MSFVAPVMSIGPALAGAAKKKQPQIDCAGCGKQIDHRCLNGRCADCNMRPCGDCGTPIAPRNKGGLCHRCRIVRQNADPEFKRLKSEGVKRKYREDHEFAERMRLHGQRTGRKYSIDPAIRARRVEVGKWLYQTYLTRPDVVAKRAESIKQLGPKMRRVKLPWCPDEYYERYRKLVKNKKMRAAEARKEIERIMLEDRAVRHPEWESVLAHIRRLTFVVRLDNGNYRVGTVELSPGQLLERAESTGYELPRWAA